MVPGRNHTDDKDDDDGEKMMSEPINRDKIHFFEEIEDELRIKNKQLKEEISNRRKIHNVSAEKQRMYRRFRKMNWK